jgi:LmbE family N-acetylglucosaminyl deacetylase
MDERRLLCILAHPDDESLGTGGILAKYAAAGVATGVLCATRGERGWPGNPDEYPGPEALGRLREAELRAAAATLGVREVAFLGYGDGELDRADPTEATGRIVAHLRRLRPQVVVTFAPDGATGHPDHIAISQLTTAAIVCAADASACLPGDAPPHRVAKLYYLVYARAQAETFDAAFGDSAMTVDGVRRAAPPWPDWAITTRVDASAHWRRVWAAIGCHRTQFPDAATLARLPDATHRALWGTQDFYRAFSLVNGGRTVEDDLFAGLPETSPTRTATITFGHQL